MKRTITLLSLVLLAALALAACSPAEPVGDAWESHEYQNLGVNFELPADWAVQESEQLINIANSSEGLDSETIPEAGATITLVSTDDFDGYSDPRDLLGFFMDYFEYGREDELERLGDPEMLTIQDLPAATVAYEGTVRGQTGRYTATIIVNGEHVALVFTLDSSPDRQHEETFDRFTRSVYVYAPAQ